MGGYSTPVITLRFDHLVDDPAGDPIWVALRNPKIMPPDALRPRELAVDAEGKPINEGDALAAMYEIIAGLVMGWRAYDSTALDIDAAGNVMPMALLPEVSKSQPATPDMVKKLPMEIINTIAEQIKQAANPQ